MFQLVGLAERKVRRIKIVRIYIKNSPSWAYNVCKLCPGGFMGQCHIPHLHFGYTYVHHLENLHDLGFTTS